MSNNKTEKTFNFFRQEYSKFWIGLALTELLGITMAILSGVWLGVYRGGYSWDPKLVFNYHPLFMTIGMIFLYGNVYLCHSVPMLLVLTMTIARTFSGVGNESKIKGTNQLRKARPKPSNRQTLHNDADILVPAPVWDYVGVMAFAITALIAAFDSHNKRDQPIPNMYSLHSWVGLVAVILFSLQWVIGCVSFLFPKLSDGLRAAYLPHHKFWGLAIFTLICAAALMGITEKAFFSLPNGAYSKLPSEAVLINLYGSLICCFAVLVVYLTTKISKLNQLDYEMAQTSNF